MLRRAGVVDPAVEDAFAAVPREAFLGPPPWPASSAFGFRSIPAGQAERLYADVLVSLDPARGVNNGSPCLHALLLHHLQVRPGLRVVHIGAGTGYYTAILSHLVGPEGQVIAVEYDDELATRAAAYLAGYPNVTVRHADGTRFPTATCDRVYVNFGIPTFPPPWIDHLGPGGRLIFPLCAGSRHGYGVALLIERVDSGFAASELCRVDFVCAEGAAGSADDSALRAALMHGGVERVRSLLWHRPADPSRCWLTTPEWSLSYDPP
ncbi:MAG TPA: methyltransferase domain-containing protein [Acidisphaera sp.]|nr:methyltransferase domain-containing protein [Acidisphaera sp.]